MSKTVVGIDIGSNAVRAVEVRGYESARPVITKWREMPLPENSVRRGEVIEQTTVATALRRLWSSARFTSKNVVLGMGGQRVFARDLVVPRAPLAQIRESLPFHVQELLPVPVADVLLDFYPIAEEASAVGPVISGLLVAGLKDAVNANIASVLAAGLRPIHVDLVPFALTRALAPMRAGARGRDVIIGLGANTTNVVVVDDGVPKFVRIIPNGGDDITRAISSRLQWAPEQAEQAKRALGMGAPVRAEDRSVIEVIYEVAGELLSNVRSTISYYAGSRPTEPVQRVVLSGGGAQLSGIGKAVSDLIGLPVAAADPFASATFPRSGRMTAEQKDSYATAFGLALGAHS